MQHQWPHVLGKENPFNPQIEEVFGDQGGHWGPKDMCFWGGSNLGKLIQQTVVGAACHKHKIRYNLNTYLEWEEITTSYKFLEVNKYKLHKV